MSESDFLSPAQVVKAAGVHEGMKVADFGAQSGFFTRAAARYAGQGGVVWAVDANGELLQRIKNLAHAEGLHNVEMVRGNCDHLGGTHLPDAHFDIVFVCNTLFAVECKPCLAQEAARVLKPGGRAVLVDWAGSFGGLGPHTDHLVGKEEMQALFEQHGFGGTEDLPAGAYHWGIMLKKLATRV